MATLISFDSQPWLRGPWQERWELPVPTGPWARLARWRPWGSYARSWPPRGGPVLTLALQLRVTALTRWLTRCAALSGWLLNFRVCDLVPASPVTSSRIHVRYDLEGLRAF